MTGMGLTFFSLCWGVARFGNASQLEWYRQSATGGTVGKAAWYRYESLLFAKCSRMLGPSRAVVSRKVMKASGDPTW